MVNALLVIAHGTREEAGNVEARRVGERLAILAQLPVFTCFIDHASPDIPTAIAALYAQGVRSIVALPLILTAAGHIKNDIPFALDKAQLRFPDLHIACTAHLGAQAPILDMLRERMQIAEKDLLNHDRARTALLVVGRGSSDPDANSEIYKVARLLWESFLLKEARLLREDKLGGKIEYASLHVGFMGVTRPTLTEALAQAAKSDVERIFIQPYFLFQGRLLARIREEAKIAAETGSASTTGPVHRIFVGESMGDDARLADALWFRYQTWLDGADRLNCGSCLYKARLAGREAEIGGEAALIRSGRKKFLGGES